jgi:hypothetical protein
MNPRALPNEQPRSRTLCIIFTAVEDNTVAVDPVVAEGQDIVGIAAAGIDLALEESKVDIVVGVVVVVPVEGDMADTAVQAADAPVEGMPGMAVRVAAPDGQEDTVDIVAAVATAPECCPSSRQENHVDRAGAHC